MCGRFTSKAKPEEIESEFGVTVSDEKLFKPRYNIAPAQIISAVIASDGERIIGALKWGLIPHWSKDDSFASKLINARAETVAEKPSFREAFKKHRCIVPASGFYEWDKKSSGAKQPYYFHLKNKEVFGFAGLWEEWLDKKSGEIIKTCAIITTEANEVLEPVHNRMPVILEPESYEQWLNTEENDAEKLQKLLAPYPPAKMVSYEVGKSVNSPGNDSPELIKP